MTTFPLKERKHVLSRSSAIPLANLPIIFAVAGAINIMSASLGRFMWDMGSSKIPEQTLFSEAISSDKGVIKFFEASVIITVTDAPSSFSLLTKSTDL